MEHDAASAGRADWSAAEETHRNLVFGLLVLGNAVHFFAQFLDHQAIQADVLFQLQVSETVKGLVGNKVRLGKQSIHLKEQVHIKSIHQMTDLILVPTSSSSIARRRSPSTSLDLILFKTWNLCVSILSAVL
jgi:hypothetical protein